MKKILFLAIIVFLTGMLKVQAQTPPIQPIPSYNYQPVEPTTYFHEIKKFTSSNKEKRDMDVVVNTRTTSGIPFFATVYVFKKSGNKILGPFNVLAGQHLEVGIDNGKWGVRVDCMFPSDVSVWIDD